MARTYAMQTAPNPPSVNNTVADKLTIARIDLTVPGGIFGIAFHITDTVAVHRQSEIVEIAKSLVDNMLRPNALVGYAGGDTKYYVAAMNIDHRAASNIVLGTGVVATLVNGDVAISVGPRALLVTPYVSIENAFHQLFDYFKEDSRAG